MAQNKHVEVLASVAIDYREGEERGNQSLLNISLHLTSTTPSVEEEKAWRQGNLQYKPEVCTSLENTSNLGENIPYTLSTNGETCLGICCNRL